MSELETYIAALREIAEATKPPYYAKAQRKAHAEAVKALEQWGRSASK